MPFPKTLKDLCPPALTYFGISMFVLLLLMFQNLGNRNRYYVGSFHCRVPNVMLMFLVKLIYILFWTYLLNLICKDGNSMISWLLIFFPFLLFFISIGLMMINFY